RRRPGTYWQRTARQGHRRGPGRDRARPLPAVAQTSQGVPATMDPAAGAPHSSLLEWILVLAAAIVLVWALGLAIRYTVRPEEAEASHIHPRILLEDVDEPEEARHR